MIPFLPPGIIKAIIEQLIERRQYFFHSCDEISTQEVARCCLTSQAFLSAAQPLLYKIIKVELLIATKGDPPQFQFAVQGRERRLLRTLDENEHLQNWVEQVHIEGKEGGVWSVTHDEDDSYALIHPLVVHSPRLRAVEVRGVAHYPEIDNDLCWAQAHRQNSKQLNKAATSFRLVAVEPAYEWNSHVFTTSYEGYKYAFSWPYKAWMWDRMLAASHDTIHRLSITLDPATTLSNFHHLEHLYLRLSEYQRDLGFPEPTNVDRDLLRILPTLSNLRFLVLSPYISESELSSLLRNDDFAHSLPSTINHLSLELGPSSVDVLAFIKNLPKTSGLTRFNYSGEAGKEGEIAEACEERGINLSLNEEWEIWWCVHLPQLALSPVTDRTSYFTQNTEEAASVTIETK